MQYIMIPSSDSKLQIELNMNYTGSARPEVRGTAEPHGGAYPP